MALDCRKSTSPSSGIYHFSRRTHPEVHAFFALSHLASRLTALFGELAPGLHVHQSDASFICSLFRPCRQALFGKGDRQVAFSLDEISKNDHMPERNAVLVGRAPSVTAIDATARFLNSTSY